MKRSLNILPMSCGRSIERGWQPFFRFLVFPVATLVSVFTAALSPGAAAGVSSQSISLYADPVGESSGSAAVEIFGSPNQTVIFGTADGTARAGIDYEAVSTTLTFSASETRKTVRIPLFFDSQADSNRTIVLTVYDQAGLVIRQKELVIVDASKPPTGDPSKVVDLINSRYRDPLHLPRTGWNSLIAKAAQNHANYWLRNGFGDDPDNVLSAHHETPGKPGFTGKTPADRCDAVGFIRLNLGCSEVAAGGSRLADAATSWLSTPYHGAPLFTSKLIGCASSKGGSGCTLFPYDMVEEFWRSLDLSNLAAPANAADSPIRVWPFDGASGVPTTWSGGEAPDPLANYRGDRGSVGTVFFAISGYGLGGSGETAKVVLRDALGKTIRLLEPDQRASVSALYISELSAFFAAKTLNPQSEYSLTISSSDGRTRIVHFRTAADGSSNSTRSSKPRISGLALSYRVTTPRKAGRVVVSFRLSAKAGSRLYWRLERKTSAKSVWTKVIPAARSTRVKMPPKTRTKGSHKILLSALIGKRRLARGDYRLVLIASNTRRAAFRVR